MVEKEARYTAIYQFDNVVAHSNKGVRYCVSFHVLSMYISGMRNLYIIKEYSQSTFFSKIMQ